MSTEILPLIDFSKVKKKRRNEDLENENDEELGDIVLKKKGKKKGKGKTKTEKTENNTDDKENEEFNNTNGLYSYELLLDRIYSKMKELTLNDSMTINMILPQVNVKQAAYGRSIWVNFEGIADALGRNKEQLFQYCKDDFGIEATLGASGEILFKNRVTDTMAKNTLTKYINNYVKCPVCKMPYSVMF